MTPPRTRLALNSPRDKLPPRYRLVFARLPRAVPVAPTPLPPPPPSALHSLLASKAPPEPTPAAPGESIWGNCPHNLPVTVHPLASPVPIAADDVALCVSYRASAKQIARPKPSRRGDLTWPAVACDSGTYANTSVRLLAVARKYHSPTTTAHRTHQTRLPQLPSPQYLPLAVTPTTPTPVGSVCAVLFPFIPVHTFLNSFVHQFIRSVAHAVD